MNVMLSKFDISWSMYGTGQGTRASEVGWRVGGGVDDDAVGWSEGVGAGGAAVSDR